MTMHDMTDPHATPIPAVPDGCAWRPAAGDVAGLLAAMRAGMTILPRDLTPARLHALRTGIGPPREV